MKKPPLAVIIVALVYIAAGVVGVAYHLTEFDTAHPLQADVILIEVVRVLAIVAGVLMLMGRDSGRWLAIAWMALHVVISIFHSVPELAMHAALLAVIAWFLLHGDAARYFRTPGPAR